MQSPTQSFFKKVITQERWRKKPRQKGIITKKASTKSGSISLTIADKTTVYVLKKNKNLYEIAQKTKVGNTISVAGRRWLGKLIAEQISVVPQEKETQVRMETITLEATDPNIKL